MHLLGTFAGVDEEVVPPSATHGGFTSTTIKVMDESGRTEYARQSRDFVGVLPELGEAITLAVWPRPYVSKKDDALRCSWTAYRLVTAPRPALVP